jgi:hypothetical protein
MLHPRQIAGLSVRQIIGLQRPGIILLLLQLITGVNKIV